MNICTLYGPTQYHSVRRELLCGVANYVGDHAPPSCALLGVPGNFKCFSFSMRFGYSTEIFFSAALLLLPFPLIFHCYSAISVPILFRILKLMTLNRYLVTKFSKLFV